MIEKTVASLAKEPVAKIQEIYKLTELISLINFINSEDKSIPLGNFGELYIDENGDLEFLASKSFLKDLSMIRQNQAEFYLKKEIGKVLGVDSNE